MKFFANRTELSGTCYHEFSMGHWDGVTFGREDSIYLHDDILYRHNGFMDAITRVIRDYSPYGEVTINRHQWELIGQHATTYDGSVMELYQEANLWAIPAFERHNVITILGI